MKAGKLKNYAKYYYVSSSLLTFANPPPPLEQLFLKPYSYTSQKVTSSIQLSWI
jgi:hypothetical protein